MAESPENCADCFGAFSVKCPRNSGATFRFARLKPQNIATIVRIRKQSSSFLRGSFFYYQLILWALESAPHASSKAPLFSFSQLANVTLMLEPQGTLSPNQSLNITQPKTLSHIWYLDQLGSFCAYHCRLARIGSVRLLDYGPKALRSVNGSSRWYGPVLQSLTFVHLESFLFSIVV